MKSLTWLKYDFTAEIRPKVEGPDDSLVAEQYPPTGEYVNFTFRSNQSTTIRVLAPEPLPLSGALVSITDRHGDTPFAPPQFGSTTSSEGDFWVIYHREPIYDTYGNLIYYLHMAKRMS